MIHTFSQSGFNRIIVEPNGAIVFEVSPYSTCDSSYGARRESPLYSLHIHYNTITNAWFT
jgi:hypothetical protein